MKKLVLAITFYVISSGISALPPAQSFTPLIPVPERPVPPAIPGGPIRPPEVPASPIAPPQAPQTPQKPSKPILPPVEEEHKVIPDGQAIKEPENFYR